LIDAIRQRLSSVNASVPLTLVLTMQEMYDASMTRTSFALVMLGIAASMALVLGSSASTEWWRMPRRGGRVRSVSGSRSARSSARFGECSSDMGSS
jgi:hypothetical protein